MEMKPWMWWAVGGVVLLLVLRGKSGGAGRAAYSADVSQGSAAASGLQSQLARSAGAKQSALDSLELDSARFNQSIQKQAASLQLGRLSAVARADAAEAGAKASYFERVGSQFAPGGPPNGCKDGKAYFDLPTMSIQCRSKTSGLRKPAKEVTQWLTPKVTKAADGWLANATGGWLS
jgi:hypothetical protein